MRPILRETTAPFLALFASASTLVCCALPAFLVTVGAGALMVGLTSTIPGYIWLTAHKGELFILSGVLLAGAGIARWITRNAPCPVDHAQAKACAQMRKIGGLVLWTALSIYAVGVFFAFFADDLLL